MGNLDKMLLVLLPHLTLLLPEGIFANDERAYPFSDKQVYDALRGGMQVVVNASGAFDGHTFHASREVIVLDPLLQLCFALVIVLIDAFDGATVNKLRDKAHFV